MVGMGQDSYVGKNVPSEHGILTLQCPREHGTITRAAGRSGAQPASPLIITFPPPSS